MTPQSIYRLLLTDGQQASQYLRRSLRSLGGYKKNSVCVHITVSMAVRSQLDKSVMSIGITARVRAVPSSGACQVSNGNEASVRFQQASSAPAHAGSSPWRGPETRPGTRGRVPPCTTHNGLDPGVSRPRSSSSSG